MTDIISYVWQYTAVEANRKAIQRKLIEAGRTATPQYDCGPDGPDGVLGTDTEKAIIRFRLDHGLSGAPAIDHDLLRALKLEDQVSNDSAPTSATVDTQPPLLSTSNWALIISLLGMIAPFVGLHLPADYGDTILHLIAALGAAYSLIRKMFFTKTISTFVAKRL